MRGVPKTLIAAIAALLLATALAACGGGDSNLNATETASRETGGAAGRSGSGGGHGNSGNSNGAESGSGNAGNSSDASSSPFVPKHHNDSGGGSKQFKVKGGDNSVQEFGAEANTSELDAAAAALHNFLDARAAGNWDAACNYLSKGATEALEKLAARTKQIEDASCRGILEKLTNPAAKQLMQAEAAQANVGSMRIEGGRAFVIYTGVDNTVFAIPMANEDGTWKVASLAGTPLS